MYLSYYSPNITLNDVMEAVCDDPRKVSNQV
jgi:hypothetical protein